MSDAIELATAFVTIVPSLEGSQGALAKALIPEAEEAAEQAGGKGGPKMGAKLATAAVAAFAALGVGQMLGAALAQGMEMEQVNAKLTASMALTADESAKAGSVAGSLWANAYGDSAEDVSTAVGAVMSSISGMRGASEADLEGLTAQVLSMAEAFDMDVTEAASAAGRMIESGFASNGTEAVDLLTASLTKVPAAMRGDLIDAANEYSGYLTDLGLSGEEAMGALVAASGNGTIAIDKTGDALKELSIRSTDMSASSVAAYEAAGLNAEDMAQRFLAGGDTARGALDDLVNGLSGIEDPTARANAAIALFGTPLEDIGVNKIPEFLNGLSTMDSSLGDVEGSAATLDEQLNNNTATSLEAVKRSFSTAVSEGLTPFLTAAKPLLDFLVENPTLLQAVAVGLGVLAVGLGIAAAAQWVMNAALFANPITWVVVAVVALIAAIVALAMNWETVVAWITTAWGGFVDWLGATWNAIVAGVTGFGEQVGAFFIDLWNGIVTFATDSWNGFTAWLSGLWQGVVDGAAGIWNGIATFLSDLWNGIQSTATTTWNSIVGWITGIPSRTLAGLAALGDLAGKAAGWFLGVLNAAKDKFGELVSWVGGIPGRITATLGNLGSLLLNSGKNLVDGFLRGIKNAWSGLTSWVSQGMSNLRGLWPFSPAKWGPFSGHGYVTYSGEAMTRDFAASIADGTGAVHDAALGMMDAAAVDAPTLSAAPNSSSSTVELQLALERLIAAVEAGQEIVLDGDALVGATSRRTSQALASSGSGKSRAAGGNSLEV